MSAIILIYLILLKQENLVPNPSFEEYRVDHCGLSVSVKQFKTDNYFWVSPTIGCPNIYSKTVKQSCWNYIGDESPDQPKTGNRMMMICNFGSGGFRSYAKVKLFEPLQKGVTYTIKVWVRVPHNARVYSPNLNILFSSDTSFYRTSMRIEREPQFEFEDWSPNGWVKLEGHFQADLTYEYMTIGNFRSNEETEVIKLDAGADDSVSWLYIDDFELTRHR